MGFQSDYLLRLIEMMGVLLQRIMGRIAEGEPAEAVELADDAIGELAGLPVSIVDAMSGEGLVAFLSAGGEMDVEVARALAGLLAARADAHDALGDMGSARQDRDRARLLQDAAGSL
ncbi:MAG: hypothetical protein JXE06_03865 [Coriobacteriia bacterium]|nr:hypothetical protein [Coriobacteriia bacterium]MBN2822356.1 hypothetical protein [Coriobacteriia bacterium]